MNDRFPTAVLVSLVTTFSYGSPTGRGSGRISCPIAREAQRPVRQCPAWWNHWVGSHQVPRDPLSNSGLTEELDEPIGTAAA